MSFASTALNRISIQGQSLVVTGRLAKVLSPRLEACRIQMDEVESSLVRAPINLLSQNNRVPNLGLLPVIEQILVSEGLEYHVRNRTVPRQVNAATLPTDRPALTSFLQNSPTGIIASDSSSLLHEVIAWTVTKFPIASAVVIDRSIKKLESAARRVKDLLDVGLRYKVAVVRSGLPYHYRGDEQHSGVIFSTFGETANLDFSQADFVFFLDANQCTFQVPQKLTLANPDHQFRLFGLLDTARQYSPYENAVQFRTFGPEKLVLGANRTIKRTVQLARVPWRGRLKPGKRLHGLVWSNRDRNLALVNVAQSLTFDPRCEKQNRNIALLVNDIQHASVLSKLLTDWELYTGQNLNRVNGSTRNRIKRQRANWRFGQRSIVVLDEVAHKFPGWNLDIAIWAGASPNTPKIPCSWGFQDDDGVAKPLMIVDFNDDFGPHYNGNGKKGRRSRSSADSIANRWSRWRRREFHQNEIFDCGTSSSDGRIQQFMNSLNGQRRKATS